MFQSIKVIPKKKYKEFWVDCQFGLDNFKGAWENIPDSIQTEIELNYDRCYDLHVDSLKWMQYDFDWLRYFYFFPKPVVPKEAVVPDLGEKYVVCSLVSESSGAHRMETWYIISLIKRLASKIKVAVLSTLAVNDFYDGVRGYPNVEILNIDTKRVLKVISDASLMISTDTGLKYLAYGFGVPTLEFSAQSIGPHRMLQSHKIRWNIFEERVFPIHYDAGAVADAAFRILHDKGYALLPNITDIDSQLVRRKWTLNIAKSILNNITNI